MPHPNPLPPQQILCVCCSEYNEWDRENVIMTGSADGVVRMWSIDYVEVPIGEKDKVPVPEDDANEEPITEPSESIAAIAKKMSISGGDCLNSFKEAMAKSRASERSEPSSDTEECEEGEETEDDVDPLPPALSTSCPPPATAQTRTSAGNAGAAEGFVVVSMQDGAKTSPPRLHSQSSRKDGYTWSKRLVFRARLTMHTAFERKDNTEPAAVTALAVSRDHRTVYVGDEKGRVFSWSVSSKPGKGTHNQNGWQY